jgi:hypothetical protein
MASRKEKILNSPNHTVVNIAPQILRVPAYARKHFKKAGPFAARIAAPADPEPLPQKSLSPLVFRGLVIAAIIGASINFYRMYL